MLQDGVVGLESYSPNSTAAYLALGFTKVRGSDTGMTLKASKSSKWERVNGNWCLVAFQGQRYASATI